MIIEFSVGFKLKTNGPRETFVFPTISPVYFLVGRKFNKNGELTAQWWSQDSLDGFAAKAKCVENQYSMYKVRDKYPVCGFLSYIINVLLISAS